MASKTRRAGKKSPLKALTSAIVSPLLSKTKKAAIAAKKEAKEARMAEGIRESAALEKASRKQNKSALKTAGAVYQKDLGITKKLRLRESPDSSGKFFFLFVLLGMYDSRLCSLLPGSRKRKEPDDEEDDASGEFGERPLDPCNVLTNGIQKFLTLPSRKGLAVRKARLMQRPVSTSPSHNPSAYSLEPSDFMDLEDENQVIDKDHPGYKLFKPIISESEAGSSDEYAPQEADDNDEEDEDDEDEEDDQSDEDETAVKKPRNQKVGVLARQRVRAARDADDVDDSPAKTYVNLFLSSSTSHLIVVATRASRAKKAKSLKGKDGLRANWKQARHDMLLPPGVKRQPKKTRASHSSESDDEGPMQQEGDLFEEDEAATGPGMTSTSGAKVSFERADHHDSSLLTCGHTAPHNTQHPHCFQSTAKIVPIKNAPVIIKKKTASAGKKPRAKVTELPRAVRAYWRHFKAVVINQLSGMLPWADLELKEVQQLWDEVVSDDPACAVSTNPADAEEYDRLVTITTLVSLADGSECVAHSIVFFLL